MNETPTITQTELHPPTSEPDAATNFVQQIVRDAALARVAKILPPAALNLLKASENKE